MTSHVAWIVLAAQLAAAVVRADPAPASPPSTSPPPSTSGSAPSSPPPSSSPSSPPSAAAGDTAENQALVHLDRGVAAYRTGDYRRAHDELLAANRLAPDRPNPYRWLALTEAALGDCRSALGNIEGFLSRVAVGDPRVAELRALRERCLRSVRTGEPPPADAPRSAPSPRPPTSPPTPPTSLSANPVLAGPSPTSLPPAAPADAPLTRRWWFWTAIGAVAITAAGVTYGLTRDGPSRLPIVVCDASGCHR